MFSETWESFGTENIWTQGGFAIQNSNTIIIKNDNVQHRLAYWYHWYWRCNNCWILSMYPFHNRTEICILWRGATVIMTTKRGRSNSGHAKRDASIYTQKDENMTLLKMGIQNGLCDFAGLNTLRLKQNGRRFPDDIFKFIFFQWKLLLLHWNKFPKFQLKMCHYLDQWWPSLVIHTDNLLKICLCPQKNDFTGPFAPNL